MESNTLGFLGLGDMGGAMVRNLLKAGYEVVAFDLDGDKLQQLVDAGAVGAADAAAVVAATEIVMTSLPSSDIFVRVADEVLLPNARPEQIFIELGTTTPPEMRRLAAAFKARGAHLLDVPLSGGMGGAEKGDLYMFAGGDEECVEACRPVLEVIGGREKLTYCGPSGAGQVVKGVNQLMMGLGSAAYIEAIAFGVHAGVDAETIAKALAGEGRWRKDLTAVAAAVAAGHGVSQGVKFRELPYFLREAQERGFSLPLTQRLYEFCAAGERVAEDDKRPAPSFWHELMQKPSE